METTRPTHTYTMANGIAYPVTIVNTFTNERGIILSTIRFEDDGSTMIVRAAYLVKMAG